MTFLLRLRHWQLFLLTWGIGLLLDVVSVFNLKLLLYSLPVIMLLFCVGLFGWVWAIATGLFAQLPPGTTLRLGRFKALFLVPLLYIGLVLAVMGGLFWFRAGPADSGLGAAAFLIVPLHLFSMGCIFYGLRFAAKVLKSVELQREAHFSDYAAEFFLLWFSFVGVWILQPRLNQLAGSQAPDEF
ncbi:hypothetical protein [Hymenobacter chitinivorans]|uniref:Transmembrane protein n=1 Tax=Hymenobacter chitinivorans DSM 11115 TaxID=1121954 RepID=A0A2M9BMA0_9BACT|nr:hypothetical protein [Hymenobacter chitinivorans]PJJ59084.1 hypothetical protein CLV45_0497 [Hymenobacter chitinivorans DSM 11115]